MTTLTDTPVCADPEHCTNESCTSDAHMPDREDPWTAADDAAWLWDDDRARRRADV